MKTLSEIKQSLYAQLPYLKEKYGVVELGIFGSYSRNEQHDKSDVDIAVKFDDVNFPSLLGLVGMENYLSKILEVKTDLADMDTIKPRIRERVFNDMIKL